MSNIQLLKGTATQMSVKYSVNKAVSWDLIKQGLKCHPSYLIEHLFCPAVYVFCGKLQALSYDILSPTTAITGYVVDVEKLSPNGQFFTCAQMAVGF